MYVGQLFWCADVFPRCAGKWDKYCFMPWEPRMNSPLTDLLNLLKPSFGKPPSLPSAGQIPVNIYWCRNFHSSHQQLSSLLYHLGGLLCTVFPIHTQMGSYKLLAYLATTGPWELAPGRGWPGSAVQQAVLRVTAVKSRFSLHTNHRYIYNSIILLAGCFSSQYSNMDLCYSILYSQTV